MTWFIITLALLLRLPLLNQSLWLDEAIQALALQGHYGPLLSYALSDFQPPLYHFLLSGWTQLFGYSELALRTPSLLAGVLLVYFVLQLGTLLYTPKVGKYATLLTATNPLLIYYSQEGRTYMLTTLLVTMSCYYLARLQKDKSAPPLIIIYYFLVTAAVLWTSYLAWFVILLQLGYLLYLRRFDLARWPILAFITLLAWLPSFVNSLQIGLGDAATSPEWGRVVGGISAKALLLTWVKSAIGRISFTPSWLYVVVLLPLFFLHEHALRFVKKPHPTIFVWLGALVPAALVSFWVPAYSYTRVLFVVPAYLLLLALGLSRLPKAWLYLLVAAQLLALSTFWFTPRFHREDWRGLTAYLNMGDGAVAMPSRDQLPPLIYYGVARRVVEPAREPLPADQVIYYVRYAEEIFDPGQIGQANLMKAGYNIQSEVSFTGIPLLIYENRP